ncbi:MAG: hypothetical protein MZV65_37995 [Chromatiales bacterium]|nr:hypothetical protein [Chromatiales bacterium]
MATGAQLLALAETRLGEKYLNVQVPKDNPGWHGPWDCAEFTSWAVYQIVGKLYGCTNNRHNPAMADAYSGAWARDAADGTLIPATQAEANDTPGVVLILQATGPRADGAHRNIGRPRPHGRGGRDQSRRAARPGRGPALAPVREDPGSQVHPHRFRRQAEAAPASPHPKAPQHQEPAGAGRTARAARKGLRSRQDRQCLWAAHHGRGRGLPGQQPAGGRRYSRPRTARKLGIPWPDPAGG